MSFFHQSSLKSIGQITTIGIEMGAYLLLFVKGGAWLDKAYHTSPILERVGAIVGITAGFYTLWKRVKKACKPPSDTDTNSKKQSS